MMKIKNRRYLTIDSYPEIWEWILFALVLVTSWAAIMPTSFLDETLLGALFIYIVVTKKKLNTKLVKCCAIYVIWCILGLLFNLRLSFYSIAQLIDSMKPMILLILVMALEWTENKVDCFIEFVKVINIPSVIVAIINSIRYNYLHQSLLIETGTLKEVDGRLIERAGGLLGHSGPFSTTCAVVFIAILFKSEENSTKKIISLLFWGMGLYVGKGRFPLIVAAGAVLFYLWNNLKKEWRKYFLVCLLSIVVLTVIPLYRFLTEIFSLDIESQIRFIAIRMIFVMIQYVIFFGVGIGNIGNTNSYLENSDLYVKYDILGSKGYDWESQFAKSMLQTGVIGTILWYYPFIYALRKVYGGRESRMKTLTIYLLWFFLINSIINKTYELPFLLIVVVLSSSQIVKVES